MFPAESDSVTISHNKIHNILINIKHFRYYTSVLTLPGNPNSRLKRNWCRDLLQNV